MADFTHQDQTQLLKRLSDGFAALLQQVDEFKRNNEAMEKLLGNEKQISSLHSQNERKAQELAISDGVEAFEVLKRLDGSANQDHSSSDTDALPKRSSIRQGPQPIGQQGSKKLSCPFASLAKEQPTEQQPFEPSSSLSHRPNSLPTPPDTSEHYAIENGVQTTQGLPAHPPPAPLSTSCSLSKCPIRLLDERPPEEIAEYFETHKHEIPRSHEVCVKRYQSNEQSIRLLDAKYGNLVNMIQGLGMKHQPLLPHKDEEPGYEAKEVEQRVENSPGGGDKVEAWFGDIRPAPVESVTNEGAGRGMQAERESHFERPLKEIRVGESPSRPWGISIPVGAATQVEDTLSDRTAPESKLKSMEAEPSSVPKSTLEDANVKSAQMPPANVIFNGPVFIGYPPEQAAAFLKQVG